MRAHHHGVDIRLILPAAAAWAVAAVAIGFDSLSPVAAWSAAAASVVLIGIAMGSFRRRGLWAVAALSLVAIACVLFSASVAASVRHPAEFRDAAAHSRQVTVEALVTQTVHDAEVGSAVTDSGGEGAEESGDDNGTDAGHDRRSVANDPFRATAHKLAVGTSTDVPGNASVSVPVMIFGTLENGGASVGDTVRVTGSLVASEPGDSAAYRLFASTEVIVTNRGDGVVAAAADLRARFLSVVESLPGDGAALLPGLAIGDTTLVSDDLDNAMKLSSLSHLTAVSGANCAIIVALVMAVGGMLRWRLPVRIVVSIVILAGFVVLVTPEPSVLRAAVMALAVLAGRLFGRGAGGLPALAAAVIVLLMIDPWLARSVAFTLSVFATAGLLVFAGPLTAVLGRWLPSPIAAVIALPLAAQLACQPVIVLLAPTIPVWGVVANILAAPAAPVATVVGLAACVLAAVSPFIAGIVAAVAWLPAAWIAAVATWFASVPHSQIPWWEGVGGMAACVVVTGCALAAVLGRRRQMRRSAAFALACVAIIVAGATAGSALRSSATTPGDWQFAACDVGQGDAMVLRSGQQVAVIDTGQHPELISECLDRLGIGRIHLLVLTHFDADHVGGAEAVVGRVENLLAGPTDGRRDEALLEKFERGGAAIHSAARGMTGVLGELRWQVLWPPRAAAPEPGNDASVVLAVSGAPSCEDCLTSVLLGDLGREAQLRLAAVNRPVLAALAPIDVVKAAHHGSRDQAPALYELLSARIGVIGVGADNDYGHPTADILAVLRAQGVAVARTDRHGLVLLAHRGGEITLWMERGG